ncbi:hypothetical protein TNCV_1044381 [Trichonephila clavipes]|nr:hypothetical protein TNCV_1044381 [Trichonephila clavipes]
MTDLSEFEKGMIVGMRCTGCSVTETAIYLGRAKEYCICRYDSIQEMRECDVWQAQQWTEKKSLPTGIKSLNPQSGPKAQTIAIPDNV